jgi:serine/threonine-protein kinase
MGRVYRAYDSSLGRSVAIKVLPAQVVHDRQRLERFIREARTASALNHPNVVTIYEIGSHGETHFIAMELLEGETLRERISRAKIDLKRMIDIVAQVADGIAAAHSAGIVHRDLKPENIIITLGGFAKVLDFGLAKLRSDAAPASESDRTDALLTAAGVVVGTAGYMSPEQAQGKPADHRSDIFALGCILYELVTQRRAFRGESSVETLHAIIHGDPTPLRDVAPDSPVELQRIIHKCLAKDPDARYQSAKDLAIDLRSVGREMDSQPQRPAAITAVRQTQSVWIGALLVAIVIAVIVIALRRNESAKPAPALSAQITSKSGSTGGIRTLAVLPFRLLDARTDDQFLAIGMADAVITRVAQVHSLIVRPTSSVLKYAGAPTDPLIAGREQGAESVVDGRVQHVGNRIRVSVQLLRVVDGSSIWADHFDEPFSDVLAVQDAISERVARALVASLTREEHERLTRRYTENVDAYQLYLRGRYFWERRTVDSIRKSVRYYQQAIATDQAYALAYAGLADSYNMLGAFSVLAPIEAYPKAKAAAAKALEIDPTLAQAEIAKSYASYLYDRDWETAERGFRHALDENPNYGPGHQWYAVCLVSRGRFDDARSEIRRALEVDPTSLIINAVVAWIDYLTHDSEAAIAAAKRAIEMDANFPLTHMYLGEAYASAGRYDDAAAELRKGGALQGRTNIGYVGFVLCRAHHFDDARKVLLEIQERSRREYISPYHEALIHLGLGDKEKAIDLLGRAADQHYPWVIHYNVEPVLDSLQNEKRFKLLLRRIGLPDLSGRFGPEKSRLR